MNDDVLVTFEHVSKKFCRDLKRSMIYGVQDIAGEMLGYYGRNAQLRKDEFWALDDINFELKKGECLGLIGRNGSGKSTILKLINGLIKPDKGKITVRGRVGALIELGAGFNPILTGRENIYINGAVLGFTKKEIDQKFDAIVDFAEIDEFIDTPVQNYSSGMKVRLGFAIAAQMEPDVLLIDEVLAVGDVGFRAKCYNIIATLSNQCAIIFVSHNMEAISRISSRCMLLRPGCICEIASKEKAIHEYFSLFNNDSHGFPLMAGTGEAKIDNLKVFINEVESEDVAYNDNITLYFDLTVSLKYDEFLISITFMNLADQTVAQCFSEYNNVKFKNNGKRSRVSLTIPNLCLNPGQYFINIIVFDKLHKKYLCWVFKTKKIRIKGDFLGNVQTQFFGKWSIS